MPLLVARWSRVLSPHTATRQVTSRVGPSKAQGDGLEVELDADVCFPIREAELRTLTFGRI
jgi:hypothetical protein